MEISIHSKSPIRQAAIMSAIATLMSFSLTGGLYILTFGIDSRFWSAINMALVIPWGISIPLSFYMSKQRNMLVMTTERLETMQRELRLANKKLEHRANYDGMTGLKNRRCFFERVDQAHKQNDSNILMIIDVDHFKTINDSFGHPVGDEALKLLASIFRRVLRKNDAVGRIGGEEFAVLLPDTSVAEGQIIGEMIRNEIENTKFEPHKGVHHVITVSIGLTSATKRHDRSTLTRDADTALFVAKHRGRNRVVTFEPGMRSKPLPAYDAMQVEMAKAKIAITR